MSNASPTSDETVDESIASEQSEPPATAELAVLREENDRLRSEYRRARQHQHRQSALALAGIGVAAAIAALLFPGVRELLIVLAAIGGFGAVLTYYLTPERVMTASVVEGVHEAHAATVSSLGEELALQDIHVYIPVDDPRERARLFLPQHVDYDLPTDRTDLFAGTDAEAERGVCVVPVGQSLLGSLEPAIPDAETPSEAVRIAADGVSEQFELADGVASEVDAGRATVSVTDVRPRDLTTPDHPVVSACGVALAVVVDGPVTVADRTAEQVTFTWPTAD